MISDELALFRVLAVPWRDAIVLARLWRREVEAVVEPLPSAPLRQLPGTVVLESPQAPGLDSPQEPLHKKRKLARRPMKPPVARIWLLDREAPPPPSPTPCDHAARLLRWVRENGYGGKLVLAMDLQKIYPVMCEELGWRQYQWQIVACELRKLTRNVKPYRWVDGHRRRAYPV